MSHSLSSVVYQAYLQVTPSLMAIPCGTRPISSDLGSQPASGLDSTCPGDRLGIPGAVSFFFFFLFSIWQTEQATVVCQLCQMGPFLERKMLPPAISASCSEKRNACVCAYIFCRFQHSRGRCTVPSGTAMPGRCVEWMEQAPDTTPRSKNPFNM